jgi:protein ImuB
VVLAGQSQLGLWGGDRAAAERAARALVRVQSLLGTESVVTPVLQGGRTPAERVAWVPFGQDPPMGAEAGAPWPGALPPPAPAVVFDPGRPAALLDSAGEAVTVSARGVPSGDPARLRCEVLVGGGGPVEAWTGPWLHDVRWWDAAAHQRRAWWQVVAAGAACLVATQGGAASLEAIYD